MISVSEALRQVLARARPLGAERCGLDAALGRVLAESLTSSRDVPGYRNSAMDGYALRHADLGRMPARLEVRGQSSAGVIGSPGRVESGTAMAIYTGAPLPEGADTVVKVEDTDAGEDWVAIERAPEAGANVRGASDDIGRGDRVLEAGRALGAADLGVAASIGRTIVNVIRRPSVAIVSTGNELVEADGRIEPGQIVNSNAWALAAACREIGAEVHVLPTAADDRAAIRSVFEAAFDSDVVLSTGGVSVGRYDHVKEVVEALGVERDFWRVAQKPGKPLVFGHREQRLYFGLPGNPVSALVCFYLYARPAILALGGRPDSHLPSRSVVVGEDLSASETLTDFLRCRLECRSGELWAFSTGTQSSAVLRSMSRADALVVAPTGCAQLGAGSPATALLLRPPPEPEFPLRRC